MGPVFFLQKNRFSGFHFQINQLNSHLNQLRNPLELHKNPFQAHFQDMLLLLHPHHRHCVLGIRNSDGSGTRNWIFGYYRVPEIEFSGTIGYPNSGTRIRVFGISQKMGLRQVEQDFSSFFLPNFLPI